MLKAFANDDFWVWTLVWKQLATTRELTEILRHFFRENSDFDFKAEGSHIAQSPLCQCFPQQLYGSLVRQKSVLLTYFSKLRPSVFLVDATVDVIYPEICQICGMITVLSC